MISSAHTSDDIFLRANIRALYRKKYHCEAELNTLKIRLESPGAKDHYRFAIKEKIALRSKTKGCGYVLNRLVDKIENYEFYTCLCRLKHPITNDLLHISQRVENGLLAFEGGLLDQPAQITELLYIVADAKNKEDIEVEKTKQRGGKK
jgi:hypothetical protein